MALASSVLPVPGGPDEQNALGNAAAEDLILFGRFEELDDFAQLFHGLVDAGDFVERDAHVFLGVHFAAAAAKSHRRAGSAQPPHHDEKHAHEQHGDQQHGHVIAASAGGVLGRKVVEAALLEQLGQFAIVVFQARRAAW